METVTDVVGSARSRSDINNKEYVGCIGARVSYNYAGKES
jgi:hypothetical protein